jgi:hypothetical protein
MTTGTLRAALSTMVTASAAPYGYTITTWSSGAVLMHTHGTPRVAEVFAFIVGAVAGFAAIALLARGALADDAMLDNPAHRVLAGALHWIAAGAAVGSVALLAEIHHWIAWPLGSFAATTVYLTLASAQLAFVSASR